MIGCPKDAAACSVTGKATYIRVPDGLTPIGQLALTIRSGHRQEIVFVLSRSGARLLAKNMALWAQTLGSWLGCTAASRSLTNSSWISTRPAWLRRLMRRRTPGVDAPRFFRERERERGSLWAGV
jgi:hypothetical protein